MGAARGGRGRDQHKARQRTVHRRGSDPAQRPRDDIPRRGCATLICFYPIFLCVYSIVFSTLPFVLLHFPFNCQVGGASVVVLAIPHQFLATGE